jgi:hypothetical protein
MATVHALAQSDEPLSPELMELLNRLRHQPYEVRAELEPLVDEVMEDARFRGRVLSVAREALERLRLDLEVALFDLDVTRRERENLRVLLEEQRWGGEDDQ